MAWQTLVALLIAIPVILLPIVLVWYINSRQIYTTFKKKRENRTIKEMRERLAASKQG